MLSTKTLQLMAITRNLKQSLYMNEQFLYCGGKSHFTFGF